MLWFCVRNSNLIAVWLERNSNSLRNRDRPRQTFTGFFLAVEQKKNSTSEFSEDFSPVKHGTFKLVEEDTLTKLVCGNVVTHTSDSAKTEIQVSPLHFGMRRNRKSIRYRFHAGIMDGTRAGEWMRYLSSNNC